MSLLTDAGTWVDICPAAALLPGRGVAALVGGEQVALFLVDGELFALSNVDPASGAAVLSRGLVGSTGDRLYVASPVYKTRFDLRTGQCLDDAALAVATWPARLRGGRVELGTP